MAALNFPSSPSVNDTYTANGRTWRWNGTSWVTVASGGAGYTGSAGSNGYTGSAGVGYTGSAGTGTGAAAEDTYTTAVSITPDLDTYGLITVTALSSALNFVNPTGTPGSGQRLTIRIKDNGVARTLTWESTYRAGLDLALPNSTSAGKTMYLGFIWNSVDSKLDLIALLDNF
jgi:hypothetical protein